MKVSLRWSMILSMTLWSSIKDMILICPPHFGQIRGSTSRRSGTHNDTNFSLSIVTKVSLMFLNENNNLPFYLIAIKEVKIKSLNIIM